MHKTVGVLVMEHIAVGLVEAHKVLGALNVYPEKPQSLDPLQSLPAEGIVDCIRQQIEKVAGGEKLEAIGIGFPGIIRNGVIEDSPNFQQAKGFALQSALSSALSGKLAGTPVHVFNDADVMAA
jgi:glucokinase